MIMDKISPEVITQAQQGEKETLSELYKRFHQPVFRYLYYRVGDQQTAEDLTADVFLRMLRSVKLYRWQGAPFESWLFQIARNLAIDHYRRKRTHDTLGDDLPDPQVVDQTVERRLTSDRLVRALYKLNEPQKDVILLRFINQMPIAQVARVLQRSEDSIKGLQRRALLALRQALTDWEGADETIG